MRLTFWLSIGLLALALMKRRKDGRFTLTISLKPGRQYRFRYLLDDERWENDWAADAYVPNSFGSEDSVVEV